VLKTTIRLPWAQRLEQSLAQPMERDPDIGLPVDRERLPRLLLQGTHVRGRAAYHARRIRAPDHPWGPSAEEYEEWARNAIESWGGPFGLAERAPSVAGNEAFSLFGICLSGVTPEVVIQLDGIAAARPRETTPQGPARASAHRRYGRVPP
jgi:hypothetical protein